MKILVQKFGGTSVSTVDRRKLVIEKVVKAKKQGYSPVIVVSAMGRKGDPYATDTLLSLIRDGFKEDNPLATDLLMSCGEIISSVVMCDEFYKHGLKALPLTGGQAGIVTNENYNDASVVRVKPERILELLKEDIIPVVTGFQGYNEKGHFTTLGRGGSDVTASLLGVALNSEEIDIYTDVDGIMTADPRIVIEPNLIHAISYNEVFQLAEQGAKVIHPRAIEIAMEGNIPIKIKNTLSDSEGTLINSLGEKSKDSIVTGITHVGSRTQIHVKFDCNENSNYYDDIFDMLADNSISIDLINVFPKEKIFTIDSKDELKLMGIMDKLELKYTAIGNCSKVAIIGNRIRGVPGVMAKILKILREANIEILQTADSHTTIWCLISSNDVETAINLLHNNFLK
ncbi:aspartate kinase [Clostridium sp. MSJ-4]|uniref:Aspartokinase n=1 Tax=Clostridium simiarum TaxID=2841506 RepID=A0ABS6EXD6_9CLOT|nr:aspartate kinase [Clostridium simiarum]MBU5590658.1 aspartate kinase [Clostridium simiarum]